MSDPKQTERAERLADLVRGLFPQSGLELHRGTLDDEKHRHVESTGGGAEMVSKAVDGLHDAIEESPDSDLQRRSPAHGA